MLALPIFPGSHPPSIVGADELNFCVRDGNRWTLIAINTNYIRFRSTLSSVSRQLLYYTALPSFVKRYFFPLLAEPREVLVTRTGFEPMLMA